MSAVGVDTNISQPMLSQGRAESGFSDLSDRSVVYVGGLNVPQYPLFTETRAGVIRPDAERGKYMFYVFAAAAGVGLAWIIR
jgi:hypothetical protein